MILQQEILEQNIQFLIKKRDYYIPKIKSLPYDIKKEEWTLEQIALEQEWSYTCRLLLSLESFYHIYKISKKFHEKIFDVEALN